TALQRYSDPYIFTLPETTAAYQTVEPEIFSRLLGWLGLGLGLGPGDSAIQRSGDPYIFTLPETAAAYQTVRSGIFRRSWGAFRSRSCDGTRCQSSTRAYRPPDGQHPGD
ncbi:MAG: hypothetical protein ACOY3P_22280, partial [Planctomycetota bacterium]